MTAPRLDFLLYAHDGRGLGHASRTIAIGLALRRLAPGSRILFVSGTPHAKALIGSGSLDYLKLPSYETEIIDGKSRGVDGPSGFTDGELATLRSRQLVSIVNDYRPRAVLVDHQPQGKHKELLAPLSAGRAHHVKWILGVRGVVGEVPQLSSGAAATTFAEYYSGLLWYGDSKVLGGKFMETLHQKLGKRPFETGYVSRLAELQRLGVSSALNPETHAGVQITVAIPWLDRGAEIFLEKLAVILPGLSSAWQWHLYIDLNKGTEGVKSTLSSLQGMSNCRLMNPGEEYVESLLHSQCAVIYGGYNSLTDVLGCGVPALVLLRDLADREQQLHLDSLVAHAGAHVIPVAPEEISVEDLSVMLQKLLSLGEKRPAGINLGGAASAARYLIDFLK